MSAKQFVANGVCFDSFAEHDVKRDGVHFEFSRMFGPVFYNKRGDIAARQPKPGSRAWAVFEEWHLEQQTTKRK